MGLIKATLQPMSSVEKDKALDKAVPVQFNPTSLRLSVSNQSESGQALGVRTRQHLAAGATTLTMQLVFDTADEGTTDRPVSVRGKTRLVTQFLEPVKQGKKDAPPRVRFQWGDFIFDGIMDSATEDIDFFAENGTPLRATVDVTITGQRTKDLKLQRGPGASKDGNAAPPDQSNDAGPGTNGDDSQPDRTDTAKGGESAAAFVQRQGLDPAAWRAIANQVDDPLSLPAGQAINFSAAASLASGLASTVGFASGVTRSIADAIQAASAPASVTNAARREEARQAGFALSEAGGVGRAVETTQTNRAQAAVGESVRSFSSGAAGAAGAPGAAGAAGATGARGAAGASGAVGARGALGAAGAVQPGDRRQNGYGFGVPLRARIAPAAAERSAVVFGTRSLTSRPGSIDPPVTDDPTVAPWRQLPRPRTRDARGGDRGKARAGGCGCGCGGRCGCGH